MAKRFVDTEKFKKPFYRGLPGAYKILWDYVCNDCNHAGVWIVDFEIAQMYVGKDMPIDMDSALSLFNKGEQRILELDGGAKWFILPFVKFQYGELRVTNNAHKSVFSELKKYKEIEKMNLFHGGADQPLTSPSRGAMDKDKDMDKEMDMDKGDTRGNFEDSENPIQRQNSNSEIVSSKIPFNRPDHNRDILLSEEITLESIERTNRISKDEVKQWVNEFYTHQMDSEPRSYTAFRDHCKNWIKSEIAKGHKLPQSTQLSQRLKPIV